MLLILFVGFVAISSFGESKTWKEEGQCMHNATVACLKKFPDTPKNDTICFQNKTIQDAFKKAGKPFVQCVQQKLKTGDQCVTGKRREENNTKKKKPSKFIVCLMRENHRCSEGCTQVRGKKAKDLFNCTKQTLGKALKMFGQCWKKYHHRQETENDAYEVFKANSEATKDDSWDAAEKSDADDEGQKDDEGEEGEDFPEFSEEEKDGNEKLREVVESIWLSETELD